MNRIECGDCGEIVETSVTTVKFPFTCNSCISDNLADYEADYDGYYDSGSCDCGNCEECEGQRYENMAPAEPLTLGKEDVIDAEEISMEEVLGTPLNPTDALIADLKAQNERLTEEIEYADKRADKYVKIAKQEGVLRVSAEARLANALQNSEAQLHSVTAAALKQSQNEVLDYQRKVDALTDEANVAKDKWGIMAEAFHKAVDIS